MERAHPTRRPRGHELRHADRRNSRRGPPSRTGGGARAGSGMRVLILTSPPPTEPRPDTDDTLVQAEEIADCLRQLGHEPATVPFELNRAISALNGIDPHLVFNLVEDVPEGPDMVHLATDFLDRRGVVYTGTSSKSLRRLGRKPAMKATLRDAGLPVPPGVGHGGLDARYIVKSTIEHSSVGLDASSVVVGTAAALMKV